MAYPKLYKKNYVSADDTINVSSGDTVKANLYDRVKTTQWISSGETAEAGYNTSIEVTFKEGTVATDRVIDRVVLINTNLKDFKLQAYYNAQYNDVLTKTDNALTTAYVGTFTQRTASKIKLLMKATISAGQEKAIGEMIVTENRFDLDDIVMGHDRQDEERTGEYRLVGGIQETWFEWAKFRIAQTLKHVTPTVRGYLKALKDERIAFYIRIDGDLYPDGFYYVNWSGTWKERYDYKTERYEVGFEIKEV